MRSLDHRPPPLLPELLAEGLREIVVGPRWCASARMPGWPEEAELAAIHAPALVLWGKSERLLPYERISAGTPIKVSHRQPSAICSNTRLTESKIPASSGSRRSGRDKSTRSQSV